MVTLLDVEFYQDSIFKDSSFQLFRSIIFKKKIVQNGPDFVKLGSEILYLFFGRKMSFVLFVAILCPILAHCFLIVALRELRSLCRHVPKFRIMGRFRTVGISRIQF